MRRDKADILWSKLVRERDRQCRNHSCNRKENLNAHHIFPRSRSATRYLLENGISLCPACHVFSPDSVHKSPEGSKKFCIRIIGAKEYRRLEKLSLKYKSRAKAKEEFLTNLTPIQRAK